LRRRAAIAATNLFKRLATDALASASRFFSLPPRNDRTEENGGFPELFDEGSLAPSRCGEQRVREKRLGDGAAAAPMLLADHSSAPAPALSAQLFIWQPGADRR